MKKLFLLLIAVVMCLSLVSCTSEILSALPSEITSMIPHTCSDSDGDIKCDVCQKSLKTKCKTHVDKDKDGICDKKTCQEVLSKHMDDEIVFEDLTATYDGKPHTLEVKGAPLNADIEYSMENTQTNAGTYKITATISADGYEDYEATATLTIKQRNLTIAWPDVVGPFNNNGDIPTINYEIIGVVGGDDPKVEYVFDKNCDFVVSGDYEVKAVTKNPNYRLIAKDNTKTFTVKALTYFITFVDNNPDAVDPQGQWRDDGDFLDQPTSVRAGYELLGWYDENDNLWDFDAPVRGDMVLTAKWELKNYSIVYHLSGGTNPASNASSYTVESIKAISAPYRDGKIFAGWYLDSAYTVPMSVENLGTIVTSSINLYAKWNTTQYTTLVTGDTINSDFVLGEYLGDGAFRYNFSADVKSFAANGSIRIGMGKNVRDGAYIEITSSEIIFWKNDGDTVTKKSKGFTIPISGHITIDININGGATIEVRTASGIVTGNDNQFTAKVGEIFVEADNVSLMNCKFGLGAQAYDADVWVLADPTISFKEANSWIGELNATQMIDRVLLMSAYEKYSTDVLSAFERALEISAPRYAVWTFPTESGEAYDANLVSFIALCKENGVTPILTTELTAIDPANAAKNAAVIASGERYIDFASFEAYTDIYVDGAYTALGAKSLFGKVLLDFPEVITPNTTIQSAYADVLDSKDIATGGNNLVIVEDIKLKDGKVTVFTAKIDGTLDGDELIRIGHGYGSGYSGWLEITPTQVLDYRRGAHGDPGIKTATHKLTIKNFITIIMTQDERYGKRYTIITDGGSYTNTFSSQACNGDVAVSAEGGLVLTAAQGHFTCINYSSPIWIFGASYFSLNDANRWPEYLYGDGYDENVLIIGVGGLNSPNGMIQLEKALQYGTPKAIVWGYGINDGVDPEGGINEKTYTNHIKLLTICEEKNIIPIFFSTPCLPLDENGKIRNHEGKMDYVLNKKGEFANFDYRVASLPHAVNAKKNGSNWYDGMMSSDLIHPLAPGARNMYMELVCAFPELMLGDCDNDRIDDSYNAVRRLDSGAKQSLLSGTTIRIDTPDNDSSTSAEYVEKEFGFTFIADFTGDFTGALEIGNGKDVEGGTWVKITPEKVQVYTRKAGSEVLVIERDNEIVLREIVMVKIHVDAKGKAKISLVSSAEKEGRANNLFTVNNATWGYAGDAFAVAHDTALKDAQLQFVYQR